MLVIGTIIKMLYDGGNERRKERRNPTQSNKKNYNKCILGHGKRSFYEVSSWRRLMAVVLRRQGVLWAFLILSLSLCPSFSRIHLLSSCVSWNSWPPQIPDQNTIQIHMYIIRFSCFGLTEWLAGPSPSRNAINKPKLHSFFVGVRATSVVYYFEHSGILGLLRYQFIISFNDLWSLTEIQLMMRGWTEMSNYLNINPFLYWDSILAFLDDISVLPRAYYNISFDGMVSAPTINIYVNETHLFTSK